MTSIGALQPAGSGSQMIPQRLANCSISAASLRSTSSGKRAQIAAGAPSRMKIDRVGRRSAEPFRVRPPSAGDRLQTAKVEQRERLIDMLEVVGELGPPLARLAQ